MKALKLTALALGSLVAVGAAHADLTLNTTIFQATNVYTMSLDGAIASATANVTIHPVGNTTPLAPIELVDPNTELSYSIVPMSMPVTKAVVKVQVFKQPLLQPISGEAMRSALRFTRTMPSGTKSSAYGNFRLSFTEDVLYADVFNRAGVTTNIKAMTFVDNNDTKISLVGFALNLKGSVKELRFTDEAATLLGGPDGMALSPVLFASLRDNEFGKLDINVTTSFRKAVNATPLTAADVAL